jgi:hypothetical protein
MKTLKMLPILLVTALLAASAGAVTVPTIWNSAGTTTATGDLNGVTVNISNAGTTQYPALILNYDMSTADYNPYPLSASQFSLDYSFDVNWTATFSAPVPNLMLYCKFWRGPNNGPVDPPTFDYEFDQPFTIVSGMANCSISGNTLVVPSTIFQDGILMFTGPVSTLSVLSNNGNSASRQGLTFAVEIDDTVATENTTWDAVKTLYR